MTEAVANDLSGHFISLSVNIKDLVKESFLLKIMNFSSYSVIDLVV